MGTSTWYNKLYLGWFIAYNEGSQVIIPNYNWISFSDNNLSFLANSVDPEKMPHHEAFCQGLHCLAKNPNRGLQYTKKNP